MGKRSKLNPPINKQSFKRAKGNCRLCGEKAYETLNVHRLKPRAEGGKYRKRNVICICANCHAKVHAGTIQVDRLYFSTQGWLLRIIDKNGQEFFL